MNRMLRLFRDNAKAQGRKPLRAETTDEEATLYLYDIICDDELDAEWFGGVAPESFVKTLNAIDAPVIHLRINSPGGSVFGSRAIEAAIRAHPSTVVAHVDGYAASAASLVAVACDEVEMLKGAFIMIHKAWTITWGNADEIMETAALLEKIDESLAKTYADKSGLDVSDIAAMMAAETWMDGEEAVEKGFADRLSEGKAKNSAGSWNLSAYERSPRQEAVVEQQSDDNRERYERLSRLHGATRHATSRAA